MKIILSTEDSFSYNNGMMFTTKDSDNDRWRGNCAASFGNGWWFFECHVSNLNGVTTRNLKSRRTLWLGKDGEASLHQNR